MTSKTGTVYSAIPGTMTATATSDQVTIKIRKTGGRAETQVNVYINNVMQSNPIEYDNGSYKPSGWQSRTLNNVNGKQSSPFPTLSRREKEILLLILKEHTTHEIAEKLFISFGTVETHRRNMLIKTGVRNTAGLVRIALEYELHI